MISAKADTLATIEEIRGEVALIAKTIETRDADITIGQRLVGRVPHGHYQTTTMIAGGAAQGATGTVALWRGDGWRVVSGLGQAGTGELPTT